VTSILYSNPLSGVVPSSFLNMTKLTTMHVQRTQLKGIPEQLMMQTGHAAMSRLRRVDIGKERLGISNATRAASNATAPTKGAEGGAGGRAAVPAGARAAVPAASRVVLPRDAAPKPNAGAKPGAGANTPGVATPLAATGGGVPRRSAPQ
jgi:hypothetical protein